MTTILTDHAVDSSPFVVTVTYYDDADLPVTPSAVTWSLLGPDRETVVNSRTNVAIVTPSTSNTLTLDGADTAYSAGPVRFLTVKYTYTDSLGAQRTAYGEVMFFVDDAGGAPWAGA